jgi:hypothetical protein
MMVSVTFVDLLEKWKVSKCGRFDEDPFIHFNLSKDPFIHLSIYPFIIYPFMKEYCNHLFILVDEWFCLRLG